MVSPQYIQLIEEGPFPNHIDPWAEQGHYFHQIHAQMIGLLIQLLRKPLLELGYVAGRESTIQIIEHIQPDFFVLSKEDTHESKGFYSQVAAQAELEIGVALQTKRLELDRLFIKALDSGKLVTVLEIISPNNKTRYEDIQIYRQRRAQLLFEEVHCVEIDLTRSIKRLLDDPISEKYPYHIAIHLHNEDARFIGLELFQQPKRFGLPLRTEVLPVDLQEMCRQAYIQVSTAAQIQHDDHYIIDHLPFPSTLSDEERKMLLERVETWKKALKEAEG